MAPAEAVAESRDAMEALLAEVLPEGDMTSRHSTTVRATPESIYRSISTLEVTRSPVIRTLFRLRGLRRNSATLAQLEKQGFIPLIERPGKALALGLAGRFWKPSGQVRRLNPDEFRAFREPGTAKAVWAFVIEPLGAKICRVITSTRVACPDAESRWRFKLYWFVVGPFSGLIRRECLRLITETAEAATDESPR